MCLEFGLNPNTAVFPRDFYGKGGAPAAGALGFQDFVGRSGGVSGAVFAPVAGSYSDENAGSANYTISCNQAVVWTWSRTSGTSGGADIASGTSATSITVSVSATATISRSATFQIQASGQTWNVTLTADASSTACVIAATPILMADGTEKAAADLKVGDLIRTRHERTLKWGAFRVTAIQLTPDMVFANRGYPLATGRHRFALPAAIARFLPERMRWWRAGWFGVPEGIALVAKITVEDAHTYMAKSTNGRWRLSHNIKN